MCEHCGRDHGRRPADHGLTLPPLIALVYDKGGSAAAMMRHLAKALSHQGVRCAGYVESKIEPTGGGPCDVMLEDLVTRQSLSLSEDRGSCARACRLDASALIEAVGRAEAAIAAGAEVLILNKFGKTEAEGGGFRSAIAAATERGVPVVIGVPRLNLGAWREFSGGLAVEHEIGAFDCAHPGIDVVVDQILGRSGRRAQAVAELVGPA
jgi:nucleoside-triphosphatase THEP1